MARASIGLRCSLWLWRAGLCVGVGLSLTLLNVVSRSTCSPGRVWEWDCGRAWTTVPCTVRGRGVRVKGIRTCTLYSVRVVVLHGPSTGVPPCRMAQGRS
eukprot:1279246-Prymnesium_polylepis.1